MQNCPPVAAAPASSSHKSCSPVIGCQKASMSGSETTVEKAAKKNTVMMPRSPFLPRMRTQV